MGSLVSLIRRNIKDIHYVYNTLVSVNFMGTLLAIAVIALTLTIPSIFYVFLQNFKESTSDLTIGRNITVYLKSDVDSAVAFQIKDDLESDVRIKSAELITKDEGLKSFAASLGINENDVLSNSENPLPHAVVILPSKDVESSTENLELLVKEIKNNRYVDLVRVDRDWFKKINSVTDAMRYITVVIASILLFSLILTLVNTVSNRVLLHRNEIEVMKLVGATDGYIIGPYVYLGMWLGVLGCFVSWWLGTIVIFTTERYLNHIAEVYGAHIIFRGMNFHELMIMFAVSTVMCMIVSFISAKSSINGIRPQ